jgi:hypothetical protein
LGSTAFYALGAGAILGLLVVALSITYSVTRRDSGGVDRVFTGAARFAKYLGLVEEYRERLATQPVLSPLWRMPVLEEILNLGRFTFSSGGSELPGRSPSGPRRLIAGVPWSDMAALELVRAFRRQPSEGTGT